MKDADSFNRVTIIGPTLPYKGGIAQYTSLLHRHVCKSADSLTISFARQYPKWLYPGNSDRDPEYSGYEEKGVNYLLDSINPLTWLKALKLIRSYQPELVIIPWWTVFWGPCFGLIARSLRRSNIQIAFICHNVIEHESAKWKLMVSRYVLSQGDHFVVHTLEDKHNLDRLLPNSTISVNPLPIFTNFPPAKESLPRRKSLELLFYGFIRPYKGLDVLIDAMGKLRRADIALTIAGEFWSGEDEIKTRITELGLDSQIELLPQYHTEAETAELFDRADVVVLPYRSATGSGIIPIAYHYNKPVIVTRVGGLPDMVLESSTGFIISPNDPSALATAILKCSRDKSKTMRSAIKEFKLQLSWEHFTSELLKRA